MVHGLETMKRLNEKASVRRGFDADGLVQLHWMDESDPSKTELVAQGGGFANQGELVEWIQRMITEKRSQCPEGWGPMVCDSSSDYFVLAAAKE